MKIVAVMWDSLYPLMVSASEGRDVKVFANRRVDASEEIYNDVVDSMKDADLIILYRTTHSFWESLSEEVSRLRDKKIICVGQDPNFWALSTVEPRICSDVYQYLLNGNRENFRRLIDYIEYEFCGADVIVQPPIAIPWQGLIHPSEPDRIFTSRDDYLKAHPLTEGHPCIGIVISRSAWVSGQNSIEAEMISELESKGMDVIPMVTNSLHNDEMGSKNIAECARDYFMRDGKSIVDAVLKMVTFMVGKIPSLDQVESAKEGASFLSELNVPVFQPIISYSLSLKEWEESDGLTDDVAWGIAMPEFEGVIEPLMLGTTRAGSDDYYNRAPIPGRAERIASRISKWVAMKRKAESERKVVFILNNNPCASVEANIGSASGLDSIRSTANILRSLKDSGYSVFAPDDAETLVNAITERKAISEFRWTSVNDIVSAGGAIYRMSVEEYNEYFRTLPEKVRKDVLETWGEPPGKSMVHDGDIIITGLRCGNAIVAVQPKRGCYGSRCDGTVCKILHDPSCPPTHQYLATYHYFRDIFGADALIHVGTHGSTEFLPGKGTGLSENCYPDVCIGDTPLIYIYNTDNPPEGSIAKRRCYSTLVGHMQTSLTTAGLYEGMVKLDSLLAQYETAGTDRARKHALHHMILDALKEAKLDDIGVDHSTPMDDAIRMCHEALTRIRTTRVEVGMHTFGEIPEGDKLVDLVTTIIRYDKGDGTITPRKIIAGAYGIELNEVISNPDGFNERMGMSNGALLEWMDRKTEVIVRMVINGADSEDISDAALNGTTEGLDGLMSRISSIVGDIRRSDEIGSLKNAFSAGYIPPGPSGYMTRGREDILPTGRNFYSLDPKRVPTTSAWRVGTRLAEALIDKYLADEGRYPESVAFQWMTSDVMAADGEMMAEILSLVGAEPVWQGNGHVSSFKIIPRSEMKHPRIDLTIRMSGILRDNFPNCVDLVDDAIAAVAKLDEPDDENFIRKHVKEEMDSGASFEDATARIFSSRPGTYTSGVNLAILSGAWKDEKDLAEIYIATNGFAYGNKRKGEANHVQFAAGLEKVSVTFNKVMTDEHDLLGCCCYYSNQGGLTAAARHLSGNEVKAYYGDTRESESVGVRTLADEIRRVTRSKVLNPVWIEGMKEHGYKGASDMMKKIVRVYGWEASTQEVDDSIFDDIATTYINDDEMRQFFRDNNPYAAEEISRRLLEAEHRGLWDADEQVLEELRNNYVEIESWMEELSGDGDYQGGDVSIMSTEEVEGIGSEIKDIMEKVHGRKRK